MWQKVEHGVMKEKKVDKCLCSKCGKLHDRVVIDLVASNLFGEDDNESDLFVYTGYMPDPPKDGQVKPFNFPKCDKEKQSKYDFTIIPSNSFNHP